MLNFAAPPMLNDQQLGKKLVEAGKVTEAALSAALAEQKRLIMEGRAARLGELLVQRGLCSAKDVQDALAGQGKKIGECDSCGARFNVVAWAPNRLYRCGKCQGVLRPVEVADDVAVTGTKVMPSVGAPAAAAKAKQKLGNITLLRELGRGGMGVVFQGVQEELRRTVAVKVLMNSDDAKLKARFLREARVVSKMRHPNIVGVHELGEADGKAYFTMDYIEGGPLNALFAPNRLPVKELLGIVATMARALDYAHKQGLVHRDIKPQNILVTTAGMPYLSDFGLAREVESSTRLTMSGAVMGTPSYMSPEQAKGLGDRVDHRSDLYSLGTVLYEGLTGRPPFDGKDLISMLEAIIKDEPAPPTTIVADVPRDVETICLKALDKQPERRYQSGEEFAADIDRFLKGEAIGARRSGAIEKGARWAKKRPALVASAAAALSVALVAGIIIWRGHVKSEEDRVAREKEIAEATERTRIAREERERFERKLEELKNQLAKAETDEEKDRIRREIEAAKVGTTPGDKPPIDTVIKPPDPPPVEAAWKSIEPRIKALVEKEQPGDALAELAAFEPKVKEDSDWKAARIASIRKSVEEQLAATAERAAGHEARGNHAEAVNVWKWVTTWHVTECTERAELEIARIEAEVAVARRESWRAKRLPALRKSVGDALVAGNTATAKAALETEEKDPAAAAADLADLKWIVALAEGFRASVYENAVGKEVDTFKYESEGAATVTEIVEDAFRVKLKNGATLPLLWHDVQPTSLVDIVRKSGGDEDGIALFWWWWRPVSKADAKSIEAAGKTVEKNQKRALEMAAKSQNGAKLAEFMNGYRAAAEGGVVETPPVDPGRDPVPAGGALAVAGAADPKFGTKWTYTFASAAESADWLLAPRGPVEKSTGWGAHLEKKADATDSQLWIRDAMVGWTGSMGRVVRIRAQGTLIDAPAGRFGVMLGGYQAWITSNQFVWSAAPSGKSLGGNIDIRKPAQNRPVVFEIWFEEGSINQVHISVDGVEVQSMSATEPLAGPTGVYGEDGSVAQWDWIELYGSLGSDAENHLGQFRSYMADARAAAGTVKNLTDGKSLGAFKSMGEGTWAASGGHLRGKSSGFGPRQEAVLRSAGARNFRLHFRYWAGSAKNFMLEARANSPSSALRFLLPSDRAGEWRDVDLLVAERCVWCTVDETIPLIPMNAADGVGTGELVMALLDGEMAIDDVTFQEIESLADGSGPGYPWPPMPGQGMGPGPGPGPGPGGWGDLWDGKTTEGFAKKDKLVVKNSELWVTGELTTNNEWPAVEIEMMFAAENTARFQVGIRKDWVAKVDVGRGKHSLIVRASRGGLEVLLDGRPIDTKGGSGDVPGPFRLKVDAGPVKIITLRHRPPP